MTCDISANISVLSKYTIGETGTITVDQYNSMVTLATIEFNANDSGCSVDETCLAKTYLILDYIACKENDKYGYTSESLGSYGYTKSSTTSDRSKWYDKYKKLLKDSYLGVPIKLTELTDGIKRNDDLYYDSLLKLDQNPDINLNNEYS